MAETTTVSMKDEFVQEIVSDDDYDMTDEGAAELWRIWTERYENGAQDDVLVAIPPWFAQDEFGRNRPYFFAQIEYDDPDKGAILFTDARQVNINVIENQIWDNVTMTQTLDVLDVSDENDHIDEQGKVWTPRSLMRIFERTETREVTEKEPGGLADVAAEGYNE